MHLLAMRTKKKMGHLKNDDPSYKACRSSEVEASQSTSKNVPSSHVCKGMKLFAQTCNRFQIPDRAVAALLHFYMTLKLSSPKKRNCSLIKAKPDVTVPNKKKRFRAVIARWHHNQCKVSILNLKRPRP